MRSDSPSRICINLLGVGARAAIADTTTPVGETMAASAKATASGIAGIIQITNKPTPRTYREEHQAEASSRIVPLS